MNDNSSFCSGLAALRPWPFGPPLRGRAPRGEARARATPGSNAHSGRLPAAPVGCLVCSHLPGCVL